MHRFVLFSALTALTVSSGSAAAAQDYGNLTPTTRTAAFIGAQARLSLGGAKARLPVARLTARMTNLGFDQNGALVHRAMGNTFEIGLSRTGRANFYVGGQRYSDIKAKLGIAPLGVALLAASGIVVVGAAVVMASEDKKQPEAVCLGIGVCPPLPRPGG